MARKPIPPPDVTIATPDRRCEQDWYDYFLDQNIGVNRTVGTLPTAGVIGRRSFVTDANATTFASIVAAGGANKVPVYDDGTNWRIG